MEEKKKEKKIYLSNTEEEFYTMLFNKYSKYDDELQQQIVTGGAVKSLFSHSKLSSEELARVI